MLLLVFLFSGLTLTLWKLERSSWPNSLLPIITSPMTREFPGSQFWGLRRLKFRLLSRCIIHRRFVVRLCCALRGLAGCARLWGFLLLSSLYRNLTLHISILLDTPFISFPHPPSSLLFWFYIPSDMDHLSLLNRHILDESCQLEIAFQFHVTFRFLLISIPGSSGFHTRNMTSCDFGTRFFQLLLVIFRSLIWSKYFGIILSYSFTPIISALLFFRPTEQSYS